MTNKPYTYLIGWSKLDVWYYGSRYAKKCDPSELWVKYFTSSNYVKKFREENGEPDVIQVRRTFNNRENARQWETKFLIRINAVKSIRWLNKTSGTDKFYGGDKRPPLSLAHKEALSKAAKLRKRSPEHIAALHAGRRNKKNTKEHNKAISVATLGRKHSNETKAKMKESRSKLDPAIIKENNRKAGLATAAKYSKDPEYRKKLSDAAKADWAKRKHAKLACGG